MRSGGAGAYSQVHARFRLIDTSVLFENEASVELSGSSSIATGRFPRNGGSVPVYYCSSPDGSRRGKDSRSSDRF